MAGGLIHQRHIISLTYCRCAISPPPHTDDNNDKTSQRILEELENIDDESDALGITFVKIDNVDEAKEYGVDEVPGLLYFEKGIPTVYEGRLEDEESVLKWLEAQTTSDEIEDITDEMLDLILEKMPYVAVLFCKLKNISIFLFSLYLSLSIYLYHIPFGNYFELIHLIFLLARPLFTIYLWSCGCEQR